jgi:CheY-like chemotaxis protein
MSKILIADQEAATVRGLTKLLRSKEFEVESVATGKELKEKLGTTKPDLILSALHLPALNGTKVLEVVRGIAGNIPVLMLCSKGVESVAALEGATDFVMKPFNAADLLTRVRRALDAAQARRTIEIPQKELHDPESGRIDAQAVANFLGVPLSKLARTLGVNYPALHKTPAAPGLQEKLRPIKQSIDLVSRITVSKSDARAWLNIPHPDLGGSTPMETILDGEADAVVTLLDNALSGIPS